MLKIKTISLIAVLALTSLSAFAQNTTRIHTYISGAFGAGNTITHGTPLGQGGSDDVHNQTQQLPGAASSGTYGVGNLNAADTQMLEPEETELYNEGIVDLDDSEDVNAPGSQGF